MNHRSCIGSLGRASCGVVLLMLASAAWSAAPPAKWRALTAQEEKEVAALEARLGRHAAAGEFEQGAKLEEQIATYRRQRQGASHWQAIDARFAVELWRRHAAVPVRDRAEVLRRMSLTREGAALLNGGRSREAEKPFRQALAIGQKVQGEDSPSTATGYINLASCLQVQGKASEALPLFHKALAISQKALGEQHPSTATNYARLAGCLEAQGKSAEALTLHRKALAIREKVLGEYHPATATAYLDVASRLEGQGKAAEALPLFRKALAIRQKVLGEYHAATAASYASAAGCLEGQGKYEEALPLFRQALAIYQKVRGENHPDTARGYSGVAYCLESQGKYGEALPLYRQALAISQKALGEEYPDTAPIYINLASCLKSQGKPAEALPLFRKALAIFLKVHGEHHHHTATSYNNLAVCLASQGKSAEALPLCRKALDIRRKVFGEHHPSTATSYANVASCLDSQGKYEEALPLFRQALAIFQKVYGEQHPRTASSYDNLAGCLHGQRKYEEALPLYREALAIHRKVQGEDHPSTALSYNNLAFCLLAQRKSGEALPLFRKALAIFQKVYGEQHPHTASSHNNVAGCLHIRGKVQEAAKHFESGLLGFEFGRLSSSASGFDRSLFQADQLSPRAGLAACLVRLKEPKKAWEHAESDLARGLLDDLADSAESAEDIAALARLEKANQALLPLLTREKLTDEERKQRLRLGKDRDDLLAGLARRASKRARDRVLPLADIQKQIPADAALVFWLNPLDQPLGCVVRDRGDPVWVNLPGSGKGDTWTKEDDSLPERTLTALRDPTGEEAARKGLVNALRKQRLAPLEAHLEGVKRLLVVPSVAMSKVPVEALTERYVISYVPSGSVYARQRQKGVRSLEGSSLLVLADPVFEAAPPPEPPASGVLVRSVLPDSNAARAGLRPGDVILSVAAVPLGSQDDLESALANVPAAIVYWRDGQRLKGRLPGAPLGAVVDQRSARAAVRAWRKENESGILRAAPKRLPGTRLEAGALAALVKGTTQLLGSDASEQRLNALAKDGKLSSYRLLHFATHGEADEGQPANSALILAQDKLPPLPAQIADALSEKKPIDGRLTVASVLKDWKLDADLVVLSACETGLGKRTGRDGMLGFTQALLQKGARSVVLSRWKVDDTATALLMIRFYENLLGKRTGLKKGMGRAAALDEAKKWLRSLSRKEAGALAARYASGVLRGSEGVEKVPGKGKPGVLPTGDKPFTHPFYWAAFVLVGEPD